MTKRDFTTSVRLPYQDAIAFVLKTMDYHLLMAIKSTDIHHREFHNKQHRRLKEWMIDMKEYIIELEESNV